MDKETLIRVATPASISLLALSIFSLPLTVRAYGDSIRIQGTVDVFCKFGSCGT